MFPAHSGTATRFWSATGCDSVAYVMTTCPHSRSGRWIPDPWPRLQAGWPRRPRPPKERIAKWSANDKDDLGFAIETLDDPPVLVSNIQLFGARPKDRCATLGIALGREYIGHG
jgi:RimJ/RimL family protein N-acetyltransferase